MPVKPIPEGSRAAIPYLIVKGAAKAIAYYEDVFGAKEQYRLDGPRGSVGHAEIMIGGARMMLSDEQPGTNARGPESYGGTPVSFLLYVEDVDTAIDQAVAAGATLRMPVRDQFYGDRTGTIVDPFGYVWTLATHKEDVPPEEIHRRFESLMCQAG